MGTWQGLEKGYLGGAGMMERGRHDVFVFQLKYFKQIQSVFQQLF